jgi:aromatic-L-amino-acid decarboxylase
MDSTTVTPFEQLRSEHERLGRAATEIVSAYAASLDGRRVCSDATPADLEKLFDEPLPREGTDAEEIFGKFSRDILPHAMNIPSPRYYGLFNPTPLPVAVWADALASAVNQNGAAWRNSPSASVVEARVLRWLCELIGYPREAFGTLTSGGSEANLVGLKCARDRAAEGVIDAGLRNWGGRGQLVVYASEQTHYSLVKAVDILGLGRDQLRKVATDARFHIRVNALREEIERDIAEGNTPCCVAGAAGATSTGVIDPLDELADVAEAYGLWFHVDAAYGGGLAFSEKLRPRLRGIERADSVTIDPHKWMFVPFACGAVLTRGGGRVLRDSFDITPEYLSENRGGADVEYDFFRYGQLGTRRFNALKIWMALKHVGTGGYASVVERQVALAEHLAARLDALEEFETVGGVETALCCARFVPPELKDKKGAVLDGLQMELQQRFERSGEAWFATTVAGGRRVLRVNVNSFLTERRHVDDLVELLRREGAKVWEERKAR